MKRALILHGTDDSPTKNWLPWLKKRLESSGYTVDVPQLPDCDVPDRNKYTDYIFDNDLYPEQGLLIGHSSGAVQVMNLLHDHRSNSLECAIMAAPWLRLDGAELLSERPEKFGPIHGDGVYDWDLMSNRAKKIIVIHSDDDPYCPIDQGKEIADNLAADFVGLSGNRHFTPNPLDIYAEKFPKMLKVLKNNNLL